MLAAIVVCACGHARAPVLSPSAAVRTSSTIASTTSPSTPVTASSSSLGKSSNDATTASSPWPPPPTECKPSEPSAQKAPTNGCVRWNDALSLAFEWFESVRRSDARRVASLMAVPSTISGFTIAADTTLEARRCGSMDATNVLGKEGLTREARTESELGEAVRCLLMSSMLVDYIPALTRSTWKSERPRPGEGVGWLGQATAANLLEPLRVFRTQIEPVVNTHYLIQAYITDEGGVIDHVLLTISAKAPARVSAVYIRERFED
jgi:hypothetical protein